MNNIITIYLNFNSIILIIKFSSIKIKYIQKKKNSRFNEYKKEKIMKLNFNYYYYFFKLINYKFNQILYTI